MDLEGDGDTAHANDEPNITEGATAMEDSEIAATSSNATNASKFFENATHEETNLPETQSEESFQSIQSEVESEEMRDAISMPDQEQHVVHAIVLAQEEPQQEQMEEQRDQEIMLSAENNASGGHEIVVAGESQPIHDDESPRFDPLLMIEPLLEDDEMPEAEANAAEHVGDSDATTDDEINLMYDDNYDDDASTASSLPETEDEIPLNRDGRRWYVHSRNVQEVVREVIAQGRRGEAVDVFNRDSFAQYLRRVIFRLNHNRHNRNRGGIGENAGEEADTDAPNDSGAINDDNTEENVARESNEEEEAANSAAAAAERAQEEVAENSVRFDTNLPAEHSYLGANMNRVAGVNYLDVGQQCRMLLFMHHHVIFPGEVLPFMISGTVIEAEDIDAQNGLLFGACFPNNNEEDKIYYGVTCQIYEKGTDARGNTLIKARALQRYVSNGNEFTCSTLQYLVDQPRLKCYGYVKILPDIYIPEPLKCINMGSMNRFRDIASMQDMYKRYQAASTPLPAHVYNEYSLATIVEKARTQLAQHKIDTMPSDPVQLSYWLVRNLHLSEGMMKTVFVTDSVNIRMKLISSTFKEDSVFICQYCGNRIANCRELFAMSKHGVQTQYCNPAGYIHQTNTVFQCITDAISHSGEPSSEFSWFPGYQWHIIICKICSRHVGWEFKAVLPNLVPKSFYGISSASVRISSTSNEPTDPRAVLYQSFLRFVRREVE